MFCYRLLSFLDRLSLPIRRLTAVEVKMLRRKNKKNRTFYVDIFECLIEIHFYNNSHQSKIYTKSETKCYLGFTSHAFVNGGDAPAAILFHFGPHSFWLA